MRSNKRLLLKQRGKGDGLGTTKKPPIISDKLWLKMLKCGSLSQKHSALIDYIDLEFDKMGIDVDSLREDDAVGYVDMIDYGRGGNKEFMERELLKYQKQEDSR